MRDIRAQRLGGIPLRPSTQSCGQTDDDGNRCDARSRPPHARAQNRVGGGVTRRRLVGLLQQRKRTRAPRHCSSGTYRLFLAFADFFDFAVLDAALRAGFFAVFGISLLWVVCWIKTEMRRNLTDVEVRTSSRLHASDRAAPHSVLGVCPSVRAVNRTCRKISRHGEVDTANSRRIPAANSGSHASITSERSQGKTNSRAPAEASRPGKSLRRRPADFEAHGDDRFPRPRHRLISAGAIKISLPLRSSRCGGP